MCGRRQGTAGTRLGTNACRAALRQVPCHRTLRPRMKRDGEEENLQKKHQNFACAGVRAEIRRGRCSAVSSSSLCGAAESFCPSPML